MSSHIIVMFIKKMLDCNLFKATSPYLHKIDTK